MDALALVNTLVAHRGRLGDTLDPALGLHPLRAALRELFDAATTGAAPREGTVAALNALAGAPRLQWGPGELPALAAEQGAAEAARTAIELLAGGRLRRCGNPRCIQFYVAQGRRDYCCAACANRTRVARHATATRGARRDGS